MSSVDGKGRNWVSSNFFSIGLVSLYLVVGALAFHAGSINSVRTYQTHQHLVEASEIATAKCQNRKRSAHVECVLEVLEAAGETSRSEQDLVAQQQMAFFTLVLSVLGMLTLGATIWALFYVRGTLLETRRMAVDTSAMAKQARLSTKAARAAVTKTQMIGEAQVRCYLHLISAHLGFSPNGQAVVKCLIKNSGQSPAKSVRAKGEICFINANVDPKHVTNFQYNEQIDVVSEADIPAESSQEIRFIIPGDISLLEFENVSVENRALLTLDVELTAVDVFGNTNISSDTSICYPHEPFEINDWIELHRDTRLADL
ncbi:hypothetical protein K3152_00470 [Qipengyuania sp. 1NDH17]|uniref:Uncharacterized protein n=1 Tax=Qipengyuania polymorpha TaxID=2867234 RepID=A0ABS7ITV1_9SPHN|nr:hypothetical protein [Qipengyuania polymorpha]MBX7456710.1 hypothetical protein [Qipengyuania polymorpha]